MNSRDLAMKLLNWRKLYSRPNMTSIERPHLNAIYVKQGETWEHASKKFQIAFEHIQKGHKIITEARRLSDGDIPDLVCYDCGEEIEVVATHGDIESYKKKGRIVILADQKST